MSKFLLGSMLNLIIPPRSSTADQELLAALERHTEASRSVVARASNVDQALANIHEAGEGLFN